MNPRPINVKALENYQLLITFQNQEQRIFNVEPLLKLPMYEKIKNKGFFSLAKADDMCIYWNEDIDICPDLLYEKSIFVK